MAGMTREEVTLRLNRKDRGPWEGQAGQAAGPCAGLGKGSCQMEALVTGCPSALAHEGASSGEVHGAGAQSAAVRKTRASRLDWLFHTLVKEVERAGPLHPRIRGLLWATSLQLPHQHLTASSQGIPELPKGTTASQRATAIPTPFSCRPRLLQVTLRLRPGTPGHISATTAVSSSTTTIF